MQELSHPIFSLLNDSQYERTENASKLLESRIKSFETVYPKEVHALLREFFGATADIELKKLCAVMEFPTSYHTRITRYYNHLIHLLLYRTERKLNCLENTSRTVRLRCNPDYSVLQQWFDKNRRRPHPTRRQLNYLSKKSGMDLQDVKVWFAYERNRSVSIMRFIPY